MKLLRSSYVISLCTVLATAWLVGCTTIGSTDPTSINFKLPKGSKLVLNREVRIAGLYSHAKFQNGEQTPGVDQYQVNCNLEQQDLGPATITPDTFLIKNSSSQREWVNHPHTMRFYKVFTLHSDKQPGVRKLICQDWDGPLIGGPVTMAEIQQALGDIFTFQFAPVTPAAAK
ncbi:MAG: hypothetical protein ABFS22_00170 [Pseudomonadota bacterium]